MTVKIGGVEYVEQELRDLRNMFEHPGYKIYHDMVLCGYKDEEVAATVGRRLVIPPELFYQAQGAIDVAESLCDYPRQVQEAIEAIAEGDEES